MTSFNDLNLSDAALSAVSRLGYKEPTPVQEQAIPKVLDGNDVIAAASTGTGKTAAFLLPTMSRLEGNRKGSRAPQMLIVSPTRELAEQIASTAYAIGRCFGIFTTAVFGGMPYGPQIRSLKHGTDVVVATPGRLCDLIEKNAVNLSKVRVLVLDEADRMLDMGFLPDIKKIVSKVPSKRQTLLFSATIDSGIRNNFDELLKDPKIIQIAKRGETAKMIDQYILPISQKEKPELLRAVLEEKGADRVIVFARTRARAEGIYEMLKSNGFSAVCIHSDKTQGQRKRALSDFKKGKAGVIVATDVLARGIDVPEVDYVVNYDLPDMAEDYIHRIGRTGRAGQEGFAVSFVSPNSLEALSSIEELICKQLPIMRLISFDVDMSILKKFTRTGRVAKRKKPNKANAKKYNYEGWGDKRFAKAPKDGKGKKRSSAGKKKAKSDKKDAYESVKEKKALAKAAGRARGQSSGKSRRYSSPNKPGRFSSGLRRGR